ncbi:HIG1 domain family member 2A, mitochondrial [Pseudolycoriella hygida]|uniref:HIG1 domain family member 2A, mitochondrial n=1 Tax=Pseudolycoriella hygida TaxID=35572 RepID=A0A9Q0MYH2_9DIPT|nr:HIG1 domain family member 2A, mitochondrial [Pseudolycoriella hygida]
MSNPSDKAEEEFDWVQFKKDYAVSNVESKRDKLIRKIKENPLVPIGCLATATALGMGLWQFRKGNSKMSQTMMRVRIGAQGFTVLALLVGVMMTMSKPT